SRDRHGVGRQPRAHPTGPRGHQPWSVLDPHARPVDAIAGGRALGDVPRPYRPQPRAVGRGALRGDAHLDARVLRPARTSVRVTRRTDALATDAKRRRAMGELELVAAAVRRGLRNRAVAGRAAPGELARDPWRNTGSSDAFSRSPTRHAPLAGVALSPGNLRSRRPARARIAARRAAVFAGSAASAHGGPLRVATRRPDRDLA